MMPGIMVSILFSFLVYKETSLGAFGLGPTNAILPANILSNCGNSSNLDLYIDPIGVIRLSLLEVEVTPEESALTTIDLNFKNLNCLAFNPIRYEE